MDIRQQTTSPSPATAGPRPLTTKPAAPRRAVPAGDKLPLLTDIVDEKELPPHQRIPR